MHYEILEEILPLEADPIINYFKNTYAEHINKTDKIHILSSQHVEYCEVEHYLEEWYNHTQANITSLHPNIWKFHCSQRSFCKQCYFKFIQMYRVR